MNPLLQQLIDGAIGTVILLALFGGLGGMIAFFAHSVSSFDRNEAAGLHKNKEEAA